MSDPRFDALAMTDGRVRLFTPDGVVDLTAPQAARLAGDILEAATSAAEEIADPIPARRLPAGASAALDLLLGRARK